MQILIMIRNQLKLLFSNRIAILAVISAPLLITFLFSFSSNGSNKTNIYLADEDKSSYSKQLISMIKNHKDFNVIMDSQENVKNKVDNNEIDVGAVIEKDFGNDLKNGKGLKVKLIENYDNADGKNLSQSILSEGNTLEKITRDSKKIGDVMKDDNIYISKRLTNKINNDNSITISAKALNLGESTEDKTTVTLIGFLVMFLWIVVIQGLRTLIEEKENNTFNRIIGTPVNYVKYLISKIAAAFIMGLVMIAVMLLAAKYFLKVSIVNNAFPIMSIFAIYLFALIGIVMIFVLLIKKHQSFTIFGAVMMALTGMLGGCFFSIDEFAPKSIQTISKFMPESWAIKSLKNVIFNNSSLASQMQTILILFCIGIIGILITIILINSAIKAYSTNK
ncbi:ABC transporter permease [Clostridium sp.]|jgi:ABC-2 type transport system permease protein|uniref:ABC transporter permease n=1 Tax=Clostridium sp. TaxID=1506 RepID=UPI00258E3202|nr:ABC transporter permease [Clostridium sp.]MDF2505213.1 permease [Clostridium sp.]